MEEWVNRIQAAVPVTAQRMGNGSWIAVWKSTPQGSDGYGHRHPDACFSIHELEDAGDWLQLVAGRLGIAHP